jgi:hypothetical protein
VHDYNPATRGEFNVLDFGAVADYNGATGTDNTAAFQAALNAAGTFAYTNPYLYQITTFGGGIIEIPKGRYKITGTLRYPAAITIKGAGLATEIAFRPASSDTLFISDTTKATKYTGTSSTLEQVTFKDLLLTGDYNGNQGIYASNTERFKADNVVIEGFDKGIYLGGTAAEGNYADITNCNIHDCTTNLYLDDGIGVVNIFGGYFWSSNTFSGAKYNIYATHNGILNIYGTSIEGRCDSAQIFDATIGLTMIGSYSENRGGGTQPFLWKKFMQGSVYGTSIYGFGNAPKSVKFENFDLIASDAVGAAYTVHSGNTFKVGDAKFLPIIKNGNLATGDIDGFIQQGTRNNGTVTYSDTKFISHGSIKLTHDGSGENGFYFLIDTVDIDPYVGHRVYITALIKTTETATVTMYANSAGNTVSKYGGPMVDYGNGWKLWALDIPIVNADNTNELTTYIYQTSTTATDTTFVTNIQAFTDGFDYIPVSRDVGTQLRLMPTALPPTTVREGMIYMDTDHHIYVYNGSTWVQLDN